MSVRRKDTIVFEHPPVISAWAAVGGKREGEGPLASGFDLLVEDAEGHSQALPTTTVEPKVRGVAVVCQGADDPLVATRVTEAVTTALGISSNRVCVVRLGDNTTEQSGGL